MTQPIARTFFSCFIFIVGGLSDLEAELLVDDSLIDGTTVGIRDNGPGQFVAGGWLVTGPSDNLRYTIPAPIEEGAVEFDVAGLRFDDTRVQNHRGQLMSMYDASFGDPRHVYAPDLRNNPFKFVLHRYGRDEEAYFANHIKLIMNTDGVNQFEDYSSLGPFPWDESKTYRMRLEWKDGIIRFFIDGRDVDRWPFVYRSLYRPAIHDIRIGTNTRNNAILGAVYSNVKIYDYGLAPAAPVINTPRDVTTSSTAIIDWTGTRHSAFEVRVTGNPEPSGDLVWSSGVMQSSQHYVVSEPLADGSTYFAHVRLRNDKGWGPWSEPRQFEVDARGLPVVPKFAEHEITLTTSRNHANPYTGVSLSATFTGPSGSIRVNGFWDGGQLFKIRMLPIEAGEWQWTTTSSDPDLDGLSGRFLCKEPSLPGYARVSKEHPHSFEWAGTGEPFFLMGDTLWHMFYNLRFFDGSFQQMIDDRAAQRFNYAHGVVHDFLHNEGGPIYRAQDHDRETFDTDTINPAYFHVIDRKIDYMNARGIVAGLFFSWGNEGYQEYETSEQYERYMRYLVARYGSKNVFWILVGEFEEAGEPRSRWRDYANVVSQNDPYDHPISLHTVATTDAFGPDESHSFVSQQRFGSPEELRRLVSESRIYDKPVINLEYGYEGDPAVFGNNQFPDQVRKDHYALTLAGGYGVYGNHTPWYSTYHRVGDFVLSATDTPGAEYLRILFDFFAGTSFHRLRPAQELVSRGIAAAWDGREYVVQLPAGGDVELDLTNVVGMFHADWFDPRTGARTSLGTVAAGGRRSFSAPDGRDWVLHLEDDGSGDPGSVQIDLGEDIEAGVSHPSAGDGNTSVAFISGRLARQNTDPGSDRYFYFSVSDAFAFEGNRTEIFITVDYFDGGLGSVSLQYDSSEGAYKLAGNVSLADTESWKTHTFHVTDAFLGNRQNSGADFRVFGEVGQTLFLDIVRVTTQSAGAPSPATNPVPGNGALDVEPDGLRLGWTPGSGATAHDVYFGATNPPTFLGRQTTVGFEPSLSRGTNYFWRVDEVNDKGVTAGNVWSFVTASLPPLAVPTLEAREARGLRIDGDPSDWGLVDFAATVRAGEILKGDHALVGYDGDGLHVAGYATRLVLPESASDHTVHAYTRHDGSSLYFLIRLEDDDLRTPHDESMNWANDAVEIYLDPSLDRGSAPMEASTSDVQIVIDAANQKNVYVTTAGYRSIVLAGIASAVSVDAAGWWLEVAIAKDAFQPAVPAEGAIGLDFNFRDNDGDNDTSLSTVYTWSDTERSGRFPSKIPDRWGELVLPAPGAPTLPGPVSGPMPSDGAVGVGVSARLSWAPAAGANQYDVHFGTSSPPPFVASVPETLFEPGTLEPETAYFWRVDGVNGAGRTTGAVWRFTTSAVVTAPTLAIARGGPMQIDGSTDDWGITGLETVVRAGDAVTGEVALVGFDNGTLYWAGRGTRLGLPVNASDHTARVHSRHDDDFLYFLVRLDDDDIRREHAAEMNWANDSVEIYLDPSVDGGDLPMDASVSDVQIVVDAGNQVNVYVTTDAYRRQVLDGIVSAVSLDSAGWWLELRIAKNALSPSLPASGSIGLDFNFRDNDGGNAQTLSSVYTWSDPEESGSFPSKIPNRWGRGRLR